MIAGWVGRLPVGLAEVTNHLDLDEMVACPQCPGVLGTVWEGHSPFPALPAVKDRAVRTVMLPWTSSPPGLSSHTWIGFGTRHS
jgi:hypothetical protein